MSILKSLLMALSLFIASAVWAQDYSNPALNDEVIVESNQDLNLPYKQRRSKLGAIFSVNYEQYSPDDYNSLILNKKFNEFTDGASIPLIGAEIGVKYNFPLGSIAGLFGYAKGVYSENKALPDNAGTFNQIDLSIMKADIVFTLDNLTSEPWIAPYIQGGIHQSDWAEESVSGTVQTEAFVADPNFHLKAGVLFQLNWIENWIDPTTTHEGLRSSGLQNTFVDVFYSYYAQPSEVAEVEGQEGEADISSSGFGVGLKLEF